MQNTCLMNILPVFTFDLSVDPRKTAWPLRLTDSLLQGLPRFFLVHLHDNVKGTFTQELTTGSFPHRPVSSLVSIVLTVRWCENRIKWLSPKLKAPRHLSGGSGVNHETPVGYPVRWGMFEQDAFGWTVPFHSGRGTMKGRGPTPYCPYHCPGIQTHRVDIVIPLTSPGDV
jgi:hypothetical protein